MTVSTLSGEAVIKLLRFLEQEGGRLMVHRALNEPATDEHPARRAGWTVGVEFGQEDPDSDMAAGASYAAESDLFVALTKVATEIRA